MSRARTLLLLGGGGHAAVVAESARAAGWSVAGYLDDAEPGPGAARFELLRLGAIDDYPSVMRGLAGTDAVAHAAVGDAGLRRRWLQLVGDAAAPAVIHPSAIVSPSAEIAEGTFIGPGRIVNARSVIERGAIVNSGAIVEHDCVLGAFSHVAPGAVLGGGSVVGPEALVGVNAAVLPGVRIGARASLGAGAVALSDVPEATTAVGVPARAAASWSQEAP